MQDHFVSIGILPNVIFLNKTETGCEAGDKCLFSHYKVEEQPSQKPKKSLNPQNGKSDDKGAVAVVKAVPQLGCVSQDSEPSLVCRRVHFVYLHLLLQHGKSSNRKK